MPQTGVEPVLPTLEEQCNCRPNNVSPRMFGPGRLAAGNARITLPATAWECDNSHTQAAAKPIAKTIAAIA